MFLRTVATAATVGVGLVALASPALAHVTVQGPGATQGGYTKLTFRAPTEKDVATTKLEIAFPSEHPIASVRVKPQPGWDYKLTKGAPATPLEAHGTAVTEVVQRITWTATGDGIGATEFGEFEVSAGALPTVERLVFKALQTYADGEVVRWIEEPVAGEEPEHPAPVLSLAPATPAATPSAAPVAAGDGANAAAASEATESDDSVLPIAALITALAALAVAAVSLFTGRRRRATA